MESLQRQTLAEWRCIVVDDASTDDTAGAVLDVAAGDPRVHLVRHAKTSGLAAARNSGLRLTDTEFVTFLDGDDFLLDESIACRVGTLRDALERSPSLAGVYHGIVQVDEATGPGDLAASLPRDGDSFRDFLTSGGECPFNVHAALVRTSVLWDIGGFDEGLRSGGEDWDLWQRVMRYGYWFLGVPKIAGAYRQRAGSMLREMSAEHLEVAHVMRDWVERPFSGSAPSSPFRVRRRSRRDGDLAPVHRAVDSVCRCGSPDCQR